MVNKRGASPVAAMSGWRNAALGRPCVEQAVACEGTPIESASFKVNGTAFLFLRPRVAMFKLERSRAAVATLARNDPSKYVPGWCRWCGNGAFTIRYPDGSHVTIARPMREP